MLKIVGSENDVSAPLDADETPIASQQDLLERVAGGDKRAFAVLYDQISPKVFGLIRRVLRDQAQSEEVTQEVFLEVWRKAARYDSTLGKAKTWVMTIAHRRAVDSS